ncbi:Tyrosine recombinase XerC [bacterium HR16]|nr:Tyrosine recombinase XerC [bacterium HR16]
MCNPQHIRRWLLHRQQQNLSTHTLHNSYRNPRAFWNWCIREGLTEQNPFSRVEPPKCEQVLKRALTPEEMEKLLLESDADMRMLMHVCTNARFHHRKLA